MRRKICFIFWEQKIRRTLTTEFFVDKFKMRFCFHAVAPSILYSKSKQKILCKIEHSSRRSTKRALPLMHFKANFYFHLGLKISDPAQNCFVCIQTLPDFDLFGEIVNFKYALFVESRVQPKNYIGSSY